MRNRKFKKEPKGLTGSALGSWRHKKMMELQRKKSRKSYKEYKRQECLEQEQLDDYECKIDIECNR